MQGMVQDVLPDVLQVPGYRILELKSQGGGKFAEVRAEVLAGGLAERADAVLFPGGRPVRIKSTVQGRGGVELAVKGAPRSMLRGGAVLAGRDWPVQEVREALLFPLGEAGQAGRFAAGGGRGTWEVRGGAFGDFNREGLVGGARFRGEGALARLRFPSAYPLMPGTDLSAVDASGRPQRFRVLLIGGGDEESAKRFAAAARFWGSRAVRPGRRGSAEPGRRDARKAPGRPLKRSVCRRRLSPPGPQAIFTFLLQLSGFIRLPPPLRRCAAPGGLSGAPEQAGEWTLLPEWRRSMDRLLIKRCSCPGGADPAALHIEDVPEALIAALMADLAQRGLAVERNGWFFPAGEPPLSPFHRSWLHRVEAAGAEGIRLRTVSSRADREALEALTRSGLIHGGEALWLSGQTVSAAAEKIHEHCPSGQPVTAAVIREIFGGSRMARMELAAALEAEGVFALQPDGITRVVL